MKKIVSCIALFMTALCCFGNTTTYASNVLTENLDGYRGDLQYINQYGYKQWMYGTPTAYFKDLRIDNKIAFCVEPDVISYAGTHYTEKELKAGMVINKNGDTISNEQLAKIKSAVFWGWDMNPNKNMQQYVYVKCLVNDILGYTTTNLAGSVNMTDFKQMKNFVSQRANTRTPSWNGESHSVKVGESLTLTDKNGAFEYLNLPKESRGWEIQTVNSNTVKFTATDKSENVTFMFRNKHLPAGYEKAQTLYVDNVSQNVLRVGDPEYLQGKVSLAVLKEKDLRITKIDDEGNKVAGVTFEVSYNKDFSGEKWEYTTGSDGSVLAPGWTGSNVYIRETVVPEHLIKSNEVKEVHLEYGKEVAINFTNKIKRGKVQIKKFLNNGDTKVVGKNITFTIYDTSGNVVETMTTNEEGLATSGLLKYGYYRIKETAPEGYAAVADIKVDISEDNKVYYYEVENIIKKAFLKIVKKDIETGEVVPLQGTRFELYANDKATVLGTYETDETGSVQLPQELTYGTYYIKEVQAPTGYVLSSDFIEVMINGEETVVTKEVANKPQKGQLVINKTGKTIIEWEKDENGVNHAVIGEQPLAGVTFAIMQNGATIKTVTTDANGVATFDNLPLGKYTYQEIEAPKDYVIDPTVGNVEFKPQEQTVKVDSQSVSKLNKLKKVSITYTKEFEESEIGFTNEKTAEFGLYTTNDVAGLPANSLVGYAKITGNEQFSFDNLPFDGKFVLKELTTGKAYQLANNTELTVDFSECGEEENTIVVETPIKNELERGDYEIIKTDSQETPLESVEYRLVALLDDENEKELGTYYTDQDGKITIKDLEVGEYFLQEIIAKEGFLLDDAKHFFEIFGGETINSEESKKVVNYRKPKVTTDATNYEDNTKEVFKHQQIKEVAHLTNLDIGRKYLIKAHMNDSTTKEERLIVQEKWIEATASEMDVEFIFDILEKTIGHTVVFGEEIFDVEENLIASHFDWENDRQTVTILEPKVKTTLLEQDTDNKTVNPTNTTLVDTVYYNNLQVGKEYTVEGQVVNKETQEVITTASVTFIAEQSEGTVDVIFEVDAANLKGQEIVAFETLTYNGVEIATHSDLEDENQTVRVTNPELQTTLMEEETSNKEIAPTTTTLVDIVEYKDLIVGQEYTVEGQVVNKETQEVIATASVTFIAEQSEGTVDVIFEVDAANLKGQEIVAFETLTYNGVEIATHSDLEDENQTVRVTNPELQTTLMEEETSNKEIAPTTTTLVDIVEYKDLIVGQEYTVEGQVVNKETQEVITTASVTFIAEQSEGTVDVIFEVDAANLKGQEIVAFETLTYNGVEIATHSDLEDENQTVRVTNPELQTTLMEEETNNKEIAPTTTTLVDIVEYKDLIVGQEYTVEGQVVNKETQEVIATASVTFIAEQSEGTVDVIFEVDAANLKGQEIVAFETLTYNGVEIAIHSDLEDENQTVRVTNPELQTTLMEEETNNKEIDPTTTTLVDVVEYKDLIVGQEYTVEGQIVNKETQEVIATSSVTFIAEQSEGTVNVIFEVDATNLEGQEIVAFETLKHNGVEIATHSDLEDENQTVKVNVLPIPEEQLPQTSTKTVKNMIGVAVLLVLIGVLLLIKSNKYKIK